MSDEIRERHQPDRLDDYADNPRCLFDYRLWPCDTARETERADKAERALDRLAQDWHRRLHGDFPYRGCNVDACRANAALAAHDGAKL